MSQERTIYEVAIIGGGFSGTLALANLIQQPNPPSSIAWFESGPELGRGVAYSTQDTSHLLNVRAVRMGAFADKPDDFYRWLHSPEGQPPARHMTGKASFAPEDYLPRALYGRYLSHIVLDALETATQKGIRVDIYPLQVEDVAHDDSLLITARGPAGEVSIAAQALVLATGNAPTATLGYSAERDPRYIQDIWKNGLNKQLAALPEDSEIVIIGTGLTMVDTVLSLETAGYKGHITALSRNGYLPIVHHHEPAYPAWEWATSPAKAPRTALGLLQGLRKEIRRAVTQGHGWRSVLDSIRPVTQTLWRQMDEAQKTRFTKRLSGFWNVHRHRMAPDIHHKIFALQQKRSLPSWVEGFLPLMLAKKVSIYISKINALASSRIFKLITWSTARGSD